MIKIIAKNFIEDKKQDRAIELASELVKKSISETGCLKYELIQNETNSKELTILEEWSTKEDLKNHMESNHFKTLIPLLDTCMDRKPEISTYKTILGNENKRVNNIILETIRNRKSTRTYKQEQIQNNELEAILDAAIQAPSAINAQPWHFTIIQKKSLIDHISEKSKEVMLSSSDESMRKIANTPINIFYNAPTVIVISGKEDIKSSLVDCSAAIENMLIAAESINLGAVWIGLIRFFFTIDDEVKKLELPNGYKPLYAVAVGYKKKTSHSGPSKRNQSVKTYIR